jgi:hypothetical protein
LEYAGCCEYVAVIVTYSPFMPRKLIKAVMRLTYIIVRITDGSDSLTYRIFRSFSLCDCLDNTDVRAVPWDRKLNVGTVTEETRFRFQTILYGVCCGQSGTGTCPPRPECFDFRLSVPFNCYLMYHRRYLGRDSSVGIATRYGLGDPGIESR